MSRTQELVDRLTVRIREGVIRPGERLPTEDSLVQTYGVSRTVVREAISRLRAAGLVRTRHGRGTFVLAQPSSTRFEVAGELNLEAVLELIELRTGCETEAAALAAVRRTEAQLADLREALDEFTGAGGNPAEAVQADLRFHRRVALASGNRYFVDLLASFGPGLIVVPGYRLDPGPARFDRVAAEHRDVYAAIERRDPEGARAAMRVHLGNSRARLSEAE